MLVGGEQGDTMPDKEELERQFRELMVRQLLGIDVGQ
jgi:hypothetical protein